MASNSNYDELGGNTANDIFGQASSNTEGISMKPKPPVKANITPFGSSRVSMDQPFGTSGESLNQVFSRLGGGLQQGTPDLADKWPTNNLGNTSLDPVGKTSPFPSPVKMKTPQNMGGGHGGGGEKPMSILPPNDKRSFMGTIEALRHVTGPHEGKNKELLENMVSKNAQR